VNIDLTIVGMQTIDKLMMSSQTALNIFLISLSSSENFLGLAAERFALADFGRAEKMFEM